MTNQYYCPTCQIAFTAEGVNVVMRYGLNGQPKFMSSCPTCQSECDKVNTGKDQEQDFDDFITEMQKQYGGGCRGGGCSCG